MKVDSYARCIFTPVKNNDLSEDSQPLGEDSRKRSSPSPELRSWLERIARLHKFRHSPTLYCIESIRLKLKTRNNIRELFEGFVEQVDWILDAEKNATKSGKFSEFISLYISHEFRVQKENSFCVFVVLNYMKIFSIHAEAAFVDLFKLNVQLSVCSQCSDGQDSLLTERVNLEYVSNLIVSEASDSLLDSDSDPEFVLKQMSSAESDSISDELSDEEEVKAKKRTHGEDDLKRKEENLCNPFLSSASDDDDKKCCNPFNSDSDQTDVYNFHEELPVGAGSPSETNNKNQLNLSSVPRMSSVKVKSQVKSHICDHCGKKFSTSYNLVLHNVQVHRIFPEGKKIYKCPEVNCKYVTGSRICYNRHATTHLRKPRVKKNNYKISCSYCSLVVANKSSLKRHLVRKHS